MKDLYLLYTHSEHCIGLFIDGSKRIYSEIPSKFIRSLGFVDEKEYVKVYPGKLHNMSAQAIKATGIRSDIIPKMVETCPLCMLIGHSKLNILNRRENSHYWKMVKHSTDITYAPTLKETKFAKIDGSKGMPLNEFWFCLDWRGDC